MRSIPSRWSVFIAVSCLGCGAPPKGSDRAQEEVGDAPRVVDYRVALPASPGDPVRIEACAQGLGEVRWGSIGGAEVPLDDLVGECIDYEIAPMRAAVFPSFASGGSYVGGHGSVFLRPLRLPEGARARVHVDDQGTFSSPWPFVDGVAHPGPTFFVREGHIAFGSDLRVSRFEVGDVEIERAVLPGALNVDDASIDRWLSDCIEAVGALTGGFPRPRVHFVVVPVMNVAEPSPFGLVRRGGGPSVLLLVSAGADFEALRRDWVAVHELTHLVFPMVDRADAWVSEGISTYFQEVLRGKAGMIAPREAWRRLDAGFERGRRSPHALPLGEESRRMRETRNYHRVYWSGAVFALLADLELRLHHESSFEALIEARSAELSEARDRWSGRRLLAALEATLDTPILTDRARAFAASRAFPDLGEAYAALGLLKDDDGSLRFSDQPQAVALRTAIMGDD